MTHGVGVMIDWGKTAFVFPGQGSQAVGMGQDFASEYPAAREIFAQANETLGFDITTLCFSGPEV